MKAFTACPQGVHTLGYGFGLGLCMLACPWLAARAQPAETTTESALRSVLRHDPANSEAHYRLGVLLASKNQLKPAQHELESADAFKPGDFTILYNLGQVLLRSGLYAQSEAVLHRALKVEPGSIEAQYLLAETIADAARPMDALALLVRAHNAAPANMDVILLMAHISMSQRYYQDAIPLLQSGLSVAPQRTDLRAALGESYLMADQVDQSIEQFNQLIAAEPTARSYTFLGLGYQRLGRFEEAKQAFAHGLKLDPGNSECRFHLGFIAERQGNATEAEARYQAVLHAHPDYPDALFELANLRIAQRKLADAAVLLRKYVKLSHNPATGYYKLAMVERSLQQPAAADRDLQQFQIESKKISGGQYPNEHLFDYLEARSKMAPQARAQLDIADLTEQLKAHPDQPQGLYLLAESYFQSGQVEEAERTVEHLDKVSAKDYLILTGAGVLLARYRLYDAAIQHFQAALQLNEGADDVRFDLADAYFRKGRYAEARTALASVGTENRKDDAYLALLGDIAAHLGDTAGAKQIFSEAIRKNPDNDQDYLSLALLELRARDVASARKTLLDAQAHIAGSGKVFWGMGLVAAIEGNTATAGQDLERAVDTLPEWPGSYSLLGVFYFQTGQVDKAREVLDRFKNTNQAGALDIDRIEQVLARAPAISPVQNEPLSAADRQQLLQLALTLADRTL